MDSVENHALATVGVGRSEPRTAERVLLIGVRAARLLTYESILQGAGLECVRADSLRAALKHDGHSFAAVILDVRAAAPDEVAGAQRLREVAAFAHTPIVLITGQSATELEALRGYELHAIDYIAAPVVPEVLRSKVALLVELSRRRAQLEALNRELEDARSALQRTRDSRGPVSDVHPDYLRAIFERPGELAVVLRAVRDDAGAIVDWQYRDLNAGSAALLKKEREQVIGRRLSEVVPERAERLIGLCARVLAEGAPYRYESSVGDTRYSICLFAVDANTVVSCGTDITARARAEDEAQRLEHLQREENEWLNAVLDSMTEEVYFADTSRRYTYANPAALRQFGHLSVEGVAVERIVTGLEVLRADGTRRPLEEAPPLRSLAGETVRDEEQIVRIPRTGELRHRQVSSAPVRDRTGAIIGSVSVVRDVTEQKRSEQALAIDLEYTRLLRDLAGRSIGEHDLQQLFDDILDAALTITGADAGTIQLLDESGEFLTFVATRGFTEALTTYFARVDARSGSPCGLALAHGERVTLDFDVPEAEDPDGSSRLHFEYGLLSAQSTPLTSRSGRPLGMFSTHWRTRRRLDEREQRFLDILARQAADLIERTRARDALRAREAELREADRRKDEFIAVLAHELRNPLVPLRAGTELLRHAGDRPDLVETVRPMMERQLAHMVRLIDDLLDVSRIASGKFELKRQPSTLASLVGSAIDANRQAIRAGSLELDVALSDPHWTVDVDATRFSQVISNLLQNAVKFTPPGGHIVVAANVAPSAGGALTELELSVSDDGDGIDPKLLPRIFDLFAQGDAPGRGKQPGLGIGLALARRIVELHGGTVTVESAGKGRGSRFTVRLPAAADPSRPSERGKEISSALDDCDVLIVDDNRDGANSMALLLGNVGATTNVAYDGPTALEHVSARLPDIVLLDLGMPDMDGYETCRRLRDAHGTKVVIVALTGWGNERDKELALSRGFDAHLTKPVELSTLVAVIGSLRAQARTRR